MQYPGSLSISGIKLIPRTSFGNLAKSTFSSFMTDDGFKFFINFWLNHHLPPAKTYVNPLTDLHLLPLFSRQIKSVEVRPRSHFLEEAAETIWRLVNNNKNNTKDF